MDDSNHEDGLVDFGLEMALYRFIGIQFEENMLIGFRCNPTRATKRRDLCLIHLPVELSHLNCPLTAHGPVGGESESSQLYKNEYVVALVPSLYN